MTLDEYCQQEQEFAEHVCLDLGNGLEQVHHPIPKDALPVMRKIWTLQYFAWQAIDAMKAKELAIMDQRRGTLRNNAVKRAVATKGF